MRHPQKGFSLVELMIAITLALIVVGAIGYFYLGTRQAYRSTDNLSQLQENQRVALDVIARDIRMAGYVGCVNIAGSQINVIANPPAPSTTPSTMAQIYKDGAGWTNPTTITRVPLTDVIEVRFASGSANVQSQASPTAQVKIYGNPANFAAGDVLMISDCSSTDIFRATTVSASGGLVNIAHGAGANTAVFFGIAPAYKVYNTNATIMAFHDVSYFIGTNPASGNKELYRVDTGIAATAATPEAIAENVENMQAQYGLDNNSDGAVDAYNTAIPAGANVIALQVGMAFVGTDNAVATSAQTYNLLGTSYGPIDTRLRQAANITVVLRNQALF